MNKRGVSGVVGAGLSLGVGELLAGVFDSVASPLASIGNFVVRYSPAWLEDFAIGLFGTADKAALAIGTVIIVLVIGWFVGIAARRRFWVAAVVFGGFALIGALAGVGEPMAEPIPVFAAALVSLGAGLGGLWFLLRLAEPLGVGAEPTDTLADDEGRRRFIGMAAAGGVLAVGAGVVGRRLLSALPSVPILDLQPPTDAAVPPGPDSFFEVPNLTPIVVPNNEFYRIDTALVIPRVDEVDWTLRITGAVDRPLEITYADLLARPLVEDYVTISCVSNRVGGHLVGNALWTGVRLVDLLEEAGVRDEGAQIVGRSIDDWTAGFPTEFAFDGREPLVAIAMNGEALPRRHGFPARLIVPGLYGYVSATKWLSEIHLTGWDDFDGYWVPRGWSKEGPIKTQSRVDVAREGAYLVAGAIDVAGVAWAPTRGIERVEVSVDDGAWREAEVSSPLSARAWVQWRAVVDVGAGDHQVRVRATDGTGATQTEMEAPPRPDGATGHHTVRFSTT
jgi:DMSO/TMAO reductase YedYZ molybdopterin-dependent catalytic subunit